MECRSALEVHGKGRKRKRSVTMEILWDFLFYPELISISKSGVPVVVRVFRSSTSIPPFLPRRRRKQKRRRPSLVSFILERRTRIGNKGSQYFILLPVFWHVKEIGSGAEKRERRMRFVSFPTKMSGVFRLGLESNS